MFDKHSYQKEKEEEETNKKYNNQNCIIKSLLLFLFSLNIKVKNEVKVQK
jgi:hypothetical protein